ncbi:hypothetical protein DFH08DRAFT_510215 [Mycena albidolilacea]|uniref:SH3 domain-containing protein n=1 Tax=Mycena albidolilacea TaxID=1033008 RepID=A0AAD7AF06_9AGAR|nr:hypothetical protein DFH08DRAFT_510215 [Mycena albidolilacea]
MRRILQRLPAEQVRHRKRLPSQGRPDAAPLARQFTLTGPVTLTLNIPNTNTNTANAITTPSPVVPPPSPPAIPPPSPPAVPPVTLTPPTIPSVPAAQSPVSSIVSVPSGVALTPVASAIPPKSTASATEGAQNNSGLAVSNPHGLPTGAVVGITIACVMLILGAFIFFIRQRAVRNRKLRQQTAPWLGAPRNNAPSYGAAGMAESSAGASFARAQQAALAQPPAPYPMPVPPTMPLSSYNNPVPAAIPAAAASAANAATVRYEFIPSLPDELSITTGETVALVAEYDDGWALCKNARGEQGMVPLECLDRGAAPAPQQMLQAEPQNDYRNSRRTSSLRMGY